MAYAFRPSSVSSVPCSTPRKRSHTRISQAAIGDQESNSVLFYSQEVSEQKRNGEGERQGVETSAHTGRPPTPSLNNLGTKCVIMDKKLTPSHQPAKT